MTAPLGLFAVAPPGLEAILAAELTALGISGSAIDGGVEWTGDAQQMRRVNLHSRVASRVLVRVAEFRARTFFELERHAARVPWAQFIPRDAAVSVRVSARKSRLYHQRAIAERLQIAIAGTTGAVAAGKPDEEEEGEAAQLFVVRAFRDDFTISADASGALLHRRGYRQEITRAPLRETLAAALLSAASWSPTIALLDPFCGSGTIPIEAALAARKIPPGLARADRKPRSFAFERWPSHDATAWQSEIADARDRIIATAPSPLFGSDRDAGAIAAARANAARAGVEQDIEWSTAALSRAPHPPGAGLLATNPPYGVRVSADREIRDLFAALGSYLRANLPGWEVALFSPDARLDRQLGMPLEVAATTTNGGIPVRLLVSRAR